MKETGIIMSGNHPRLILDGIKTMTRRVMKPQPTFNDRCGFCYKGYAYGKGHDTRETIYNFSKHNCPYGQVGDRLWVRATWAKNFKGQMLFKYQKDRLTELLNLPAIDILWKPSIHLRKEDAEIWLDITLLRAERLREISEADAKAEGGYSIEEFIKLYLPINHLPEDADPWNWVIGW